MAYCRKVTKGGARAGSGQHNPTQTLAWLIYGRVTEALNGSVKTVNNLPVFAFRIGFERRGSHISQ